MSDEGSDQEDDLEGATLQLLPQEQMETLSYSELDHLNM